LQAELDAFAAEIARLENEVAAKEAEAQSRIAAVLAERQARAESHERRRREVDEKIAKARA
jgi:hypothetical protein